MLDRSRASERIPLRARKAGITRVPSGVSNSVDVSSFLLFMNRVKLPSPLPLTFAVPVGRM